MRGNKVDVGASDMVLDDKPGDDLEPSPVASRIAQMESNEPPPAFSGLRSTNRRR
jgi:hypothetical protein